MNIQYSQPTVKYLISLIIVFILSATIQFYIENSFERNFEKRYLLALENQENKRRIAEMINKEIREINIGFRKMSMTNNIGSIQNYKKKMLNHIDKLQETLLVLKDGGEVQDIYLVNFDDINKFTEKIVYSTDTEDGLNEIIVNISPKIAELKNQIIQTSKLIKLKIKNPENYDDFELMMIEKQCDALLLRITESANKIFYDIKQDIAFNKQNIEKSKEKLSLIVFLIIIFARIFILSFSIVVLVKISNIIKEKNIADEKLIQYSENLEDMILDRTKELALTNSKLENNIVKIKNMQAKLINAEKLAGIGELAAGVAHELNNPINFVANNFTTLKQYNEVIINHFNLVGSLLEDKSLTTEEISKKLNEFADENSMDFILDDIDDLFSESMDGINRVTKIVLNLKNFSRIDSSQELDLFNLNEGIRSTLIVLRNEIKHVATIEQKLDDIPKIPCYGNQLNQVFLNIVKNATDCLKETYGNSLKGLITVSTSYDDKFITCKIFNNGPAIPPEIQTKIFDPFFTTKEPGKGTGLGLNISYDIIVNTHNGSLEVDSDENGTTFIIKLPIDDK